jgi:hypothetical protein
VRRASFLVTALAAVVLLAAARPPQGPQLHLTGASGALQITNSKAGEAILRGEGLRPGEAAVGSVTLTNNGGRGASLALEAGLEGETPGTGGGRLWDALDVVVSDVTDGQAPIAVYQGRLGGLGRLTLGGLAATQGRSYRFAVSLPRGAGNAYQGARLSLGLAWSAQASDAPAPPPATATPAPPPAPATPAPATPAPATPAPTAAPAAPPLPPAPASVVTAADVITLPSAKACVSRRRLAVRVRPGRGATVAKTTVYVNGRRGGSRRGARAVINLRGLPRGTVKVKVVAVLTDGRRLTLSRTYRTCKRR